MTQNYPHLLCARIEERKGAFYSECSYPVNDLILRAQVCETTVFNKTNPPCK